MARRRNPQARIIALGCYADSSVDELAAIKEIDLVIGNTDKINIIDILKNNCYLDISIKGPGRVQQPLFLLHCASGKGR
jgi:threonylcarbamoyladenosine tRNA methylthiotransferase MtaB